MSDELERMMEEEQEIELIDYLNVMWRRKGLIVGGTFLAAAAALVVSLAMPKTYEVSRTLKIGQLQGKPIEPREAVVDRLRDQRLLAGVIKELELEMAPEEMVNLVSVDARSNPNVRYTVQAPDAQRASHIADLIAENIITTQRRTFDDGMEIGREHEAAVAAALPRMQTEISAMERILKNLLQASQVDTPAIILLQANIGERQERLQSLRRELHQVRLSLSPPDSEATTVISSDVLPQDPVKPKVKMNVALAGTLGLMMFTFLAFFLEYIEKARGKG